LVAFCSVPRGCSQVPHLHPPTPPLRSSSSILLVNAAPPVLIAPFPLTHPAVFASLFSAGRHLYAGPTGSDSIPTDGLSAPPRPHPFASPAPSPPRSAISLQSAGRPFRCALTFYCLSFRHFRARLPQTRLPLKIQLDRHGDPCPPPLLSLFHLRFQPPPRRALQLGSTLAFTCLPLRAVFFPCPPHSSTLVPPNSC